MADKYGPIFDAIVKKNMESYDAGNADAAAAMYDEHGVVVDKKNRNSYFGSAQIKEMAQTFINMGKVEFKIPQSVFHDVGGDRFFVDSKIESKFVESGIEMKGTSQQLYHKKGDEWKCVYECFEMQ